MQYFGRTCLQYRYINCLGSLEGAFGVLRWPVYSFRSVLRCPTFFFMFGYSVLPVASPGGARHFLVVFCLSVSLVCFCFAVSFHHTVAFVFKAVQGWCHHKVLGFTQVSFSCWRAHTYSWCRWYRRTKKSTKYQVLFNVEHTYHNVPGVQQQ